MRERQREHQHRRLKDLGRGDPGRVRHRAPDTDRHRARCADVHAQTEGHFGWRGRRRCRHSLVRLGRDLCGRGVPSAARGPVPRHRREDGGGRIRDVGRFRLGRLVLRHCGQAGLPARDRRKVEPRLADRKRGGGRGATEEQVHQLAGLLSHPVRRHVPQLLGRSGPWGRLQDVWRVLRVEDRGDYGPARASAGACGLRRSDHKGDDGLAHGPHPQLHVWAFDGDRGHHHLLQRRGLRGGGSDPRRGRRSLPVRGHDGARPRGGRPDGRPRPRLRRAAPQLRGGRHADRPGAPGPRALLRPGRGGRGRRGGVGRPRPRPLATGAGGARRRPRTREWRGWPWRGGGTEPAPELFLRAKGQ
mmetsp:Transcript_55854/g.155543  ORF Transcript_55854/g.155543 Transcript_55854/m.155543 type:complete len:359 (+) Transcript_55854:999-2075(+)